MQTWLGLDNRSLDHDLVECIKCHGKSYEKPDRPGDKYAWRCRKCGTVNESGNKFLLDGIATYDGNNPI